MSPPQLALLWNGDEPRPDSALPPPPPEGAGAEDGEPRKLGTPFLVLQFFLFPMAIVAVCVAATLGQNLVADHAGRARSRLVLHTCTARLRITGLGELGKEGRGSVGRGDDGDRESVLGAVSSRDRDVHGALSRPQSVIA